MKTKEITKRIDELKEIKYELEDDVFQISLEIEELEKELNEKGIKNDNQT